MVRGRNGAPWAGRAGGRAGAVEGWSRPGRSPHHLAYLLDGVVDHHGELIGGRAVVAADEEVVYLFLTTAEQAVLEGHACAVRPHPEGWRASDRLALGALGRGEPTTGARVAVSGGNPVRGGVRSPNLGLSAAAGVEVAVGVEAGDSFLVEGDALGLAYDGAVPIEPYGSEIGELDLLYVRADARAIQVLHTHEKACPCRACEQPGEEGGAQVAEV